MVKPWGPCRRYILPPGVGRPNMLRFKMILVKQPKYDKGETPCISDSAKKESAETGKARTWKRAGGSTKTTCSLFAQKQSIIIDTQKWRKAYYIYMYIYNNHIIPITLSYLICRHCWHMIHAYQQQNRYPSSPWTSGRQSYGAMLPALWKNWTWPSSSWETSGQPAGEPAGNRKGVENVFWGLKSYRLMCLGWCFCDWRFQHVFFSGFHEDNVDWSGWVSRFLAVLPCLNGWEVVCYKHSWGQVQRPKKTCWPFWVSIQVPRSPWRSIF